MSVQDCVNIDAKDGISTDAKDDIQYRKALKELGYNKPDNEPITKAEMTQIFACMMESYCIGS